MSTKTSTKSSRSTASQTKSSSRSLPRLSQKTLPDDQAFDERTSRAKTDQLSTLWIIIFAFAILAVVAVVVWALFSGRSDQKIHGDNLPKLRNTTESSSETQPNS